MLWCMCGVCVCVCVCVFMCVCQCVHVRSHARFWDRNGGWSRQADRRVARGAVHIISWPPTRFIALTAAANTRSVMM